MLYYLEIHIICILIGFHLPLPSPFFSYVTIQQLEKDENYKNQMCSFKNIKFVTFYYIKYTLTYQDDDTDTNNYFIFSVLFTSSQVISTNL